jgi:hypothetical protein
MNADQLKNLAKDGKLLLHKYSVGRYTRSQYIYTDEPDILDQRIKEIKKIPYTRYYYMARTPDMPKHKMYKITAKDYRELLKDGAKEE